MSQQIILLLGAFLFCLGLFLILTRRSSIMVLIGIELMLNASNINFVVFGRNDGAVQGQMAAIFVMVIAAAEAAIALAIIFKIYKHYKTTDLSEVKELKG